MSSSTPIYTAELSHGWVGGQYHVSDTSQDRRALVATDIVTAMAAGESMIGQSTKQMFILSL